MTLWVKVVLRTEKCSEKMLKWELMGVLQTARSVKSLKRGSSGPIRTPLTEYPRATDRHMLSTKDERGTPDRRGFPDRTVQPRPDSGHGAIFCLNRGSVWSGVKKTGRVGNGVVFSRCGYFFFGPGLNFDCSEMIYTIE